MASSRDLIQKVFALDPKIRYCAIVDQRGGRLEGGMRPGIPSINPEDENHKLFLQTTVARGMSDSWTKYFDRFRFSIVAHDKLKVFQFPYGHNILLVTAEPDISLKVVDIMLKLLEEYDSSSSQ